MTANRGFSLIELMITIAVAAILMGVAAPSFNDAINTNRISADTADLIGDLALARSEALARGSQAVVCPSNTGTGCTATAWNLGRIVFADDDGDGVVDAGVDAILRVSGPLAAGSVLTTAGGTSEFAAYLPSGALDSRSRNALTVCRSGFNGRVININVMGKVHGSDTANICS